MPVMSATLASLVPLLVAIARSELKVEKLMIWQLPGWISVEHCFVIGQVDKWQVDNPFKKLSETWHFGQCMSACRAHSFSND